MKKKSLKKAAVLAIAGAMAVTSLAACGGSGSGKDSEGGSSDSLTMAWWGNQVRNERTQQALDAYKEESGITVSGQFYQWGDYWSKMATSAAGKKMPDVIQMDMSYIQQYVDKGQLLDLVRDFDVLVALDLFAVHHEANRHRVPEFRCELSAFHDLCLPLFCVPRG